MVFLSCLKRLCWLYVVLARSKDYYPSNYKKMTLKVVTVMTAPLILIGQLLFIHFCMGY